MTALPRLKPAPAPAIHPLPESLAEGQRRSWYEDTKRVLQVRWMGVVTMAYAHYRRNSVFGRPTVMNLIPGDGRIAQVKAIHRGC